MRVKIVIVDLEIPPSVNRWGMRHGIPAIAVAAGGIAYASLPHTFASGEVLTSANLNADLQNLDGRLATVEAFREDQISITVNAAETAASITSQVPAGWVTKVTSAAGNSGAGLAATVTLEFATPFSVPPNCAVNATGAASLTLQCFPLEMASSTNSVVLTLGPESDVCSTISIPSAFNIICVGLK